ncbi:MAG: SDR family oxidoreductase [Chloroflexi bacterium]|nr:SDR family oxidoreductase [Chloroflexota bacterium]MCI0799935.1 SDR family oxidoreductase [Chloroflexota bacterium]MCI0824911.1 SDR family oxidoreductase [Chloroflexota bacterium]MCI0893560.1 SDR family oxidoreductase [Chloroflexota bacterium]
MTYPGLSLEGQVALVTGSARGIGAALAVGLAQAGADVAVSDIPERLDEAGGVQQKIQELGRSSSTYALDVLNLDNIQSAIGAVTREFGQLDILVNNAGIRRRKPALEVTEEDWDAVIDTNLKGVFFCAQAAARGMIERGQERGRIINIASQMAVVARRDRAAYCASKGGVANLTRVLALEWIQYGITVNAIGPGPTETPGLVAADARTPEEVDQDMAAYMPLGRRMVPEELVGAAVYLASPSAGATTGHLLIVDGGWTAQ